MNSIKRLFAYFLLSTMLVILPLHSAFALDSTSFNPLPISIFAQTIGVPVGTIIEYHGTRAPTGYLSCDGQSFNTAAYPKLYAVLNKATTPNMRGLFVRGYDPASVVDPDGATRGLGTMQGDAIRNIEGYFNGSDLIDVHGLDGGSVHGEGSVVATGAFRYAYGNASYVSRPTPDNDSDDAQAGFAFNASWCVPTAPENRPKNINLLYCIKHD
jgi:hypothetical protein